MKGIGEILTLVREEFEVPRKRYLTTPHIGLCTTIKTLFDTISTDERGLFFEYLDDHAISGKTTFWMFDNADIVEVSEYDITAFVWHPEDRESRLDWLDEHIIINS